MCVVISLVGYVPYNAMAAGKSNLIDEWLDRSSLSIQGLPVYAVVR